MLDFIISIDKNLFLFLNSLHASFFDNFMYIYTKSNVWIPLYISILYVIIRNYRKQSILIIIAFVVCLAAADQISSGIIKEVVGRLRPSHNPDFEGIIHLVNNRKSGQFGFVSSHAANTLGFALLCTLFFKNKIFSTIIFAWAIINCYTRIYLGLHYPLDIIGGSIVGFAVAIIIFSICKRFVKLQTNLSIKQLFIPIAVLAVTILTIIVYSAFG